MRPSVLPLPRTSKTVGAPGPTSLARADLLDRPTRQRMEEELDAALKRRAPGEGRVGGVLRVLFRVSPALRDPIHAAARRLLRRGSFDRELFAACLGALSEVSAATDLLKKALAAEGGDVATLAVTTLAAAAWDRTPSLGPVLARLATATSSVALGAEAARVCRGEANGARLAELAARLKESSRLAFVEKFLVPIAEAPWAAPPNIAASLGVLRCAERHLGRWLVMAQVAVRSGDSTPIAEAEERALRGIQSSRPAWALVGWRLRGAGAAPDVRLGADLVARLSDRPSAERDMAFLFALGDAAASSAQPMLEQLVKAGPSLDGIRAARSICLGYAKGDALTATTRYLEELARSGKEELRGPAIAALWDVGARKEARELADDMVLAKNLSNVAWGALVRAHEGRKSTEPLVTEPHVRLLHRS